MNFPLPDLSQFHFIRPEWLWLAAGALLVPLGVLVRRRLSARPLHAAIDAHLLEHLVIPPGRHRWLRPVHLSTLAAMITAVGAAGPTWQQERPPFSTDKAPLVIALDVSWSMNAIDIQPTRLERAKDKVRALLAARTGARSALVAYAGSAHVVMPLTDDPKAIELFLPGLTPDIMPMKGKNAAAALAMADEALKTDPVPGSILFVTDGVASDQIDAFAQYAATGHTQLLFLGIGTSAGGPVRVGEHDFQTTATGARMIARLDKPSLEALADRADAFVATITVDDADIARIQRGVQQHMELVQAAEQQVRWQDAGYYLVFPVAALAAFWFRKGWTIRWAVVLIALHLLAVPAGAQTHEPSGSRFLDLWFTPDQQGRYAFERDDYKTAAARFTDPMWKGVACYKAGDFACAVDAFARMQSPEADYNLGNALARLGEYQKAVAAYDQALRARPSYEDARINRDLVIKAMRRPKPDEEEVEAPNVKPDSVQFDDKGTKGKKGRVDQSLVQQSLMADAWLKSVQAGPGPFLRAKFAAQAAAAAHPHTTAGGGQ